MAANSPESRPTTASDDNGSIPPSEGGSADRNAGSGVKRERLSFDEWEDDNKQEILDAQLRDGFAWLCEQMDPAPDESTFKGAITDGYIKQKWFSHSGKKGGKEAFNAYWDKDKRDCLLLHVAVNNFAGSKNSWSGFDTSSRMWEDYKAETGRLSAAERQKLEDERQARLEDDLRKRQEDADERERQRLKRKKEADEEAERIARNLANAIQGLKKLKRVTSTTKHGYLATKKLEGYDWHDVYIKGNLLAIAVRDVDTLEIVGIQYVAPGGRKWFQEGTPKVGSALYVTGLPPKNAELIRLSEGWSSGASCTLPFIGMGAHVVAAIDADNLEKVHKRLRKRHPRARIDLLSDNDAKPVNKRGEPKPNKGQIKAHTTALKHGPARVAIPRIEGHDYKNVDFNDVLVQCGVEAVRQQLTDAQMPDPNVVFEGEREKDQARTKALYRNHDMTVINERYIPAHLIKPGRVNVIISGTGTGKSRASKTFYDTHRDQSRLTIVPLAALGQNKAAELGDYCYSSTQNNATLRRQRQLVICVDSLPRLVPNAPQYEGEEPETMPTFEIVTLEEPATTSARLIGGEMKHKALVLDTYRAQIKAAETLLAIDADFDKPELCQLERLRPGERFNVVINEYRAPLDVYIYASQEDHQRVMLETLGAGARVAVPCTTAAAAKGIDLLIKERLPEKRGLCITAKNDGDQSVSAFNLRPNSEVAKYQYVSYSPKWDTGISVDKGHGFTRVFADVQVGHDVPRRVLQRAARFREVGRWDLYVDTKVTAYPTNPQEIAAQWGTKLGNWDNALLGLKPDFCRGLTDADYEQLVCDKTAADNTARTNLRYNLLRLLYLRGANLIFVEPQGNATTKDAQPLIDERRKLRAEEHVAQRLSAPPIPHSTAERLEGKARTTQESAELDAYHVRRAHGLRWDAPLEERHISEYSNGLLEQQLRRLELAGSDRNSLRERTEHHYEGRDRMRAEARHYGVHAYVYQKALRLYYVDPATLEVMHDAPISATSPTVKAAIKKLITRREELIAAGFRLPDPDAMRADPMRVFSNILRRLGLTTQAGRNEAKRERTINREVLESKARLIAARREREEERKATPNPSNVQGASDETVNQLLSIKGVHCLNPAEPQASEQSTFRVLPKPDGYEVLRCHLLNCQPGEVRDLQLTYFRKADKGDEQAMGRITLLLQNPAVQAWIGAAA